MLLLLIYFFKHVSRTFYDKYIQTASVTQSTTNILTKHPATCTNTRRCTTMTQVPVVLVSVTQSLRDDGRVAAEEKYCRKRFLVPCGIL